MTVESLGVAHDIVNEDPGGIVAVYEYHHLITFKKLYSIEHRSQEGCTLASPYVINPRLVYARDTGWAEGYEELFN